MLAASATRAQETVCRMPRDCFLGVAYSIDKSQVTRAADRPPREGAHRPQRPRVTVARAEQEAVVARFITAVNSGDLQGLMDVLAPDVVSVADGGGLVRGAARRPIHGADKMPRYLLGGLAKAGVAFEAWPTWVNGHPAIRGEVDGELAGAVYFEIEGGRITRIFSIANPNKLGRLDEATELAR
ncbi:hypothetical protein [Agromyces humatus]|nr:hypothetical protein [Agromyces humatus]